MIVKVSNFAILSRCQRSTHSNTARCHFFCTAVSCPLLTRHKVQPLPVNHRSCEPFASCKPKAHDDHEQPDQNGWCIIHVGGCDGSLWREANESSNHSNEQRCKVITHVACFAQIEGSGRKSRLSASDCDDALRNGICDAL